MVIRIVLFQIIFVFIEREGWKLAAVVRDILQLIVYIGRSVQIIEQVDGDEQKNHQDDDGKGRIKDELVL